MRRGLGALVATVALLAVLPAGAGAALEVTATQRLGPRLVDLTMRTDALREPVHTRILLPDRYAAHPRRRYPVLWLLHGGFGSVRDWTEAGAAEQITAGRKLIVVMPEDGNGGWYSDWYNDGRGGPPRWETFQIRQLLPWVDANYRTIPDRGARAVAGLSTGGFGAMHLAARHPDLFGFAASFSGALDIVGNAPVAAVIGLEAIADGGQADDPFGDRVTHEIGWRAQNPLDLAANLRGLALEVYTGDGRAGPFDGPVALDPIEQQVHEMSVSFHRRLERLGIPHLWDDYGPGTHSWDYWRRDLREALPRILATFAQPPPAPCPFSFESADERFRVWGWRVDLDREAEAFVRLAGASSSGFRLRGAGLARVVTAPLYRPRSTHRVRVGERTSTLRATGAGRLRVEVPLGEGSSTTTAVRVERAGAERRCRRAR